MKKAVVAVCCMALALAFSAAPVFASDDWNSFVAQMQKREKIDEHGAATLAKLRAEAPQNVSESELWGMLWSGEDESRAAAGVALADRIFPDGDPSRWQEASGFLTNYSYRPRQLAAMDGLFTAVIVLDKMPDGEWAAARLLQRFGKSGAGKLMFIDEIPQSLRDAIDDVIARTGLAGDWSSKKIRGKMPLLPVYSGWITRSAADSRRMQYLDGFGSISGNGDYAWDRDKGRIYQVKDDTSHEVIFEVD